jgi:hypothetical protein
MAHIIFFRPAWNFEIWGGADNSLARPTYRCRWTKSIVSVETEIFSCAESQDSSFYRGWKKISEDACDFRNIESRAGINIFFSMQVKEPKEINAILTETWGEHAPSYTIVKIRVAQVKRCDVSILFCASSWTTRNSVNLGDYLSNSRAILGRPPELKYINCRATGHLTWAVWVNHS